MIPVRKSESESRPTRRRAPPICHKRAATHRRGLGSTDAAGTNRSAGSCKHESGHDGVGVSAAAVGVRQSPRPTFASRGRSDRCLLDSRKHRPAGPPNAIVSAPGSACTAKPRQGQWRLAAAYARSDRLTLGVLGAHPSNLRSMSSTIRRDRDPDHALLHPQEGGASRNCSVRGKGIARPEQPRERKQSWPPRVEHALDVRDHDRAPSLLDRDSDQALSSLCLGTAVPTLAAISITRLLLDQGAAVISSLPR